MDNTFAERLRASLEDANKSQRDLALHIGVTPAVVTHWVSGAHKPKHKYIKSIASYLQVDPSWLMCYDAPDEEIVPVSSDPLEKELIEVFRTLTIRQKTTLLTEAYKMSDGNKDS